jgi:hypothetical protein
MTYKFQWEEVVEVKDGKKKDNTKKKYSQDMYCANDYD